MQEIAELRAILDASADDSSALNALRWRLATRDQDADWAMLANRLPWLRLFY
jgi:hypothetical protein